MKKGGTIIESSQKKASRQCWECLKRRLVCDHTLPHCKKCQKAGRDCPGYDENKPLQWVQPGRITSRRRRKDAPAKKGPEILGQESTTTSTRKTDDNPIQPACKATSFPEFPSPGQVCEDTLARIEKAMDTLLWDDPPVELHYGSFKTHPFTKHARGRILTSENNEHDMNRFFKLGNRKEIEGIVSAGLRDDARKLQKAEKDALASLERMLQFMKLEDIPNYNFSTDTSDVVQAVNYYNTRIYPDLSDMKDMAPNPNVLVFPMGVLHLLPPTIHHILVCLSVNHYINSLPDTQQRQVASSSWSKVYQHRGQAIRLLSECIGKDKTRCSDTTISAVLMFMCTELQQSSSSNWRTHADGFVRLVNLRGGFMTMIKERPNLGPSLCIFVLIAVLANTTTPPNNHIIITSPNDLFVSEVTEVYYLLFPHILCPPQLFTLIIRINHLRSLAAVALSEFQDDSALCLEANDLLERTEAFIPEDWAQPGTHFNEWVTIASTYQSAVAIYCTMSLQSLTILPNSLEMNAMREAHGDRLLRCLDKAMQSPRLRKFMFWPLVVAGVEAIGRAGATKEWIEGKLMEACRAMGSSCPVKARAKLRRYWQREQGGWDECFDRPYSFSL